MPFDFLKRKKGNEPAEQPSAAVGTSRVRGIPFEGLTEEWRIVGRMQMEGRLSDVLNKRAAIDLAGQLGCAP